jgi:hypothetical protein
MAHGDQIERAVVAQRVASVPALEAMRRRELREMSDAEALDAVLALLDLVPHLPPPSAPCGLVDQQGLFARARR